MRCHWSSRWWLAIVGAAALVGGCNKGATPTATSADDPVLTAQVMDAIQRTESSRPKLLPVELQILAAYQGVLLRDPLEKGRKRIALDVVIHPGTKQRALPGIDFAELMVVAGEGEGATSEPPRVQRLTDKGEPIDEDDPALATDREFRCLLIYDVPREWSSVRLAYQAVTIDQEPVPLKGQPPRVPDPTLQATKLMAVPGDSVTGVNYVVFVECLDWPRTSLPTEYHLQGLGRDGADARPPVKVVELDIGHRPLKLSVQERPYYLQSRSFAMRYMVPEHVTVLAMGRDNEVVNLPSPAPLDLPAETWIALGLEPQARPRP